MFGFGKMMEGLQGGKAATAFKNGDMGDKLGMIGAALGGDYGSLMQMIGGQQQQQSGSMPMMQGGPMDMASMDLMSRLGQQSGLSPLVRRGSFGFGRR